MLVAVHAEVHAEVLPVEFEAQVLEARGVQEELAPGSVVVEATRQSELTGCGNDLREQLNTNNALKRITGSFRFREGMRVLEVNRGRKYLDYIYFSRSEMLN